MLLQRIEELPEGELLRRQELAERALFRMGITFAVYGDTQGVEKIFPFDLIPRIVAAEEWAVLERGLKQRIRALNLFLNDIYHDQQIVNEGILPREILQSRFELSTALRWPQATSRNLVPYHGDGPGAGPRRPGLCLGGQLAMSLGSLVCAPEPIRDETQLPLAVRGVARSPGQ